MSIQRRLGLVLEGGAHRAIYTAGVLDVFLERGICFDGVIGVSAGAIHGCSYVSGQRGRSIGYTLKYSKDRRYMSFYSWLTTGNLVGEQFCYHDLPEKLFPFDHEAFEKSPIKFYVTCSNMETGAAEYVYCDELRTKMPYLRASASIPFLSHHSEVDGKKLLDGGVTDSIPLEAFQKMGYARCVVVQTHAAGYAEKNYPLVNRLAKWKYKQYPKFIEAFEKLKENYNQELQYIEKAQQKGEAFVIRPSRHIKISHTEKNPKILRAVYQMGRADAVKSLPKLKEFMTAG
ncbi:MAG: patatin family protein [Alphaproteobacteria bacterium]|nr:patatin family protein [Alphaproteobacteria bacterium]